MRPTRRAADLLGSALRDLGMPSQRVTEKLRDAWTVAQDSAWRGQTVLHGVRGGVLEIGVRSAALRNELVSFHSNRLLAVLRTALPDVPLVAIRFRPEASDANVSDLDVSDRDDPTPGSTRRSTRRSTLGPPPGPPSGSA